MDNITNLTVHELVEKLKSNELTSEEITKAYIDRINDKEKDVGAFVTLTIDDAEKKANEIDKQRKENKEVSQFAGIPIGIKDNLCTKGVKTTCSSKMLENFVSPYDATVVEKLNKEGKTIVMVTHNTELAKRTKKHFKIKDGLIYEA